MSRSRSAGLVLIGAAAGFALSAAGPADPKAPPPFAREDPPFRSLDANLYMETAAEYRACCHQAYNLAADRLREKLKARAGGGKPPAVVLDLDETVLDNAGFQAMLTRSGLGFDARLWDRWEEKEWAKVGLIPGARDFLMTARDLGAFAVYISNRSEKNRAGTRAALDRLEIAVPDDRLLLNASETSSDKTGRREQASEKFDVLLWVGDQLRDFDEKFKYDDKLKSEPEKGIAARKAAVDADRKKFGADWIILPNSAYGEWTKPLGKGRDDLKQLVPIEK